MPNSFPALFSFVIWDCQKENRSHSLFPRKREIQFIKGLAHNKLSTCNFKMSYCVQDQQISARRPLQQGRNRIEHHGKIWGTIGLNRAKGSEMASISTLTPYLTAIYQVGKGSREHSRIFENIPEHSRTFQTRVCSTGQTRQPTNSSRWADIRGFFLLPVKKGPIGWLATAPCSSSSFCVSPMKVDWPNIC